jgi:very-short-patch-repair endonuclease
VCPPVPGGGGNPSISRRGLATAVRRFSAHIGGVKNGATKHRAAKEGIRPDVRRMLCQEIGQRFGHAAPGETRIGALANDAARQRFNVAASRAQDQLWLFHSATLDILSPACMRHHLLGYMLNPGRHTTEDGEHRFDSEFERDVFQLISGRGFHVRTQVSVGDPTNHRYRIDMVVEGMQGRLAVECDGDEWHGPERYEQDMARHRDLERAGWQFARIRGGDFLGRWQGPL